MSENISGIETVYKPAGSSTGVELKIDELFDDRYLVVERLGAGGMGTAYLANDQLTGEQVVIKVINPDLMDEESKQRMIAEGVNARKIKHPNVVSVHDVKEVNGQVYLTMEHINGKSLRNWMATSMASGDNAPFDQVVKIIQEVLSGLAAAHDAGVIHRDLKPENVMLEGTPGEADSKVKIIDFGIATGLKAAGTTTSAGAAGAPLYMAPEQLTMPDSVRPNADIYSVGRMFYEMLMEVLPDGMWNPPSATRSDVPAALDAVIQKALQPPKSRYPSAGEFSAAISQSVAGGVVPDDNAKDDDKDSSSSGLAEIFKPRKLDFKDKKVRVWAAVIAFVVIGASVYQEYFYYGPDFNDDYIPDDLTNFVNDNGVVQDLLEEFDNTDIVPELPPETNIKQVVTTAMTTQSWRGGDGNMFNMTVDNGIVSGSGILSPWGRVTLEGTPNTYVDVYNSQGQNVAALSGGLVPSSSGPGIWDYTGSIMVNGQIRGSFIFHIDH